MNLKLISILIIGAVLLSCKNKSQATHIGEMTTTEKLATPAETEKSWKEAAEEIEKSTTQSEEDKTEETSTDKTWKEAAEEVEKTKNTKAYKVETNESKVDIRKEPIEKEIKEVTEKIVTNKVIKSTDPVANTNTEPTKKDKTWKEVSEEIQHKEKPSKPEITKKIGGVPSHKAWDKLLSTYVSSKGVVNYSGLKGEEGVLDDYISALKSSSPQTSWTESAELAYWINAYNALTIKMILENYPLKSITDLHGGKPWDVKVIDVAGKSYSLNNIENDIIRPQFNEPRIHFAVNCAAKSCPPLANKAFTESNLISLLDIQTKAFVNNPSLNTLEENSIVVSKIFDWYGKDFGNVAAFISKYAASKVSPTATVSFNEYDWSLNGK